MTAFTCRRNAFPVDIDSKFLRDKAVDRVPDVSKHVLCAKRKLVATYRRITDRGNQCKLLVGQRDIPDVYQTVFELDEQARVIDLAVDDRLNASIRVQMMKIVVEDDLAIVQLPDKNLIGPQNGEHLLVTVVVRIHDGERMIRIAVESREDHRAIAHRAIRRRRRRRVTRDGQR